MKTTFADRPQVYKEFFTILKAFKGQTLTTVAVMDKVAELFCGRDEFIIGFNKFLPAGFSMISYLTPQAVRAQLVVRVCSCFLVVLYFTRCILFRFCCLIFTYFQRALYGGQETNPPTNPVVQPRTHPHAQSQPAPQAIDLTDADDKQHGCAAHALGGALPGSHNPAISSQPNNHISQQGGVIGGVNGGLNVNGRSGVGVGVRVGGHTVAGQQQQHPGATPTFAPVGVGVPHVARAAHAATHPMPTVGVPGHHGVLPQQSVPGVNTTHMAPDNVNVNVNVQRAPVSNTVLGAPNGHGAARSREVVGLPRTIPVSVQLR
jgi:hypothetical protein